MPEYFPGTDIGSNHDLVLPAIKLKLKIKRFTKSPRIRFDLEKLKDPKIAEMFQAKVGGKFSAFCFLDSDVDTLANSLKEVLLSTSEEVLCKQRKKIQLWVKTRFWICATKDGRRNKRSTQALKQA